MSAESTARALGDECRSGQEWKCRCSLCGGRLALGDRERGLLAKCWGGCEARDVYAELWRLGYLSSEQAAPLTPAEIIAREAAAESESRRKIAQARDLWNEARPIKDTLADHYLRVARGIDVLNPFIGETAAEVLGFHPRCWHSSPRIYRPAVLAKIEHVELGFIGVSATYLALDGAGKTTLDPPRKVFGACKGGAVRLAFPKPGHWFVIGEGLETTLSVIQSCTLPGWACLSATGIENVLLPADATHVLVAADNDKNNVGERAAHKAAARFSREGRWTKVIIPQQSGRDFNDLLLLNDEEGARYAA